MRTVDNTDLGDVVNRLLADVQALKLRINGPDVVGIPSNPSVDSINIGGFVLDLVIDEVQPATGQPIGSPLLLTTGATIDDVFVDVEWLPPLDGSAVEYEVEMARETAPGVFGEITYQRTGATTVRFAGLEALTKYGFRVTAISRLGLRSNPSPLVHQTITTGADAGIPPVVTGVIIARGATTAVVKFTPLTYAEARDVAAGNGNYEVQIDTSNLFNTGNLRSTFTNDQIVAFADLVDVETWYARVRAIDKSNNTGLWSDVAGPTVAGGVIDSMIVAGLDAAKITVGFLDASRLEADTITADKLTTSELTAADIRLNGGSFTVGASPTVNGIVINSQGLRAYKSGVQTVSIDSNGDAVFKGTLDGSTGVFGGTVLDATGIRVLVSPNTQFNQVYAYRFVNSVGTVKASLWSYDQGTYNLLHIDSQGVFGTIYYRAAEHRFMTDGYLGVAASGTQRFSVVGSHVAVTGTFSVSSTKNFLIDHPLDPDRKKLIHSSLEGPEAGVYYRGVDRLKNGKAEVTLPTYFEALTRRGTATVYVTPIASGANVPRIAATRVTGRTFRVEGEGSAEFFWHVMAERDDVPPLEVEVAKEDVEGSEEWSRKRKALAAKEHVDAVT